MTVAVSLAVFHFQILLFQCYKKHNDVPHPADQLDRALCAIELRSHMFAAVSSEKCMKRNSYKTLFSQSMLICYDYSLSSQCN